MQGQARLDTKPEMLIRKMLFARGLRYRIGYRVPGMARRTIDIAFPGRRLAVFVDGCFWHKCPEHFVKVKNNAEWWDSKLRTNVERDRSTDEHLQGLGWTVVRVWEHEPPDDATSRICRALEEHGK